jgi:DivIVA domain-containing protein
LDAWSLRQEEFASQWWGYAMDDVDVFLDGVADSIENGRPFEHHFSSVEFRRSARGYDRKQVDAYLSRILSEASVAPWAPAERAVGSAQSPRNSQVIAEDEERKPPSQPAVNGPGVRGDATGSLSKRATKRQLQREEFRVHVKEWADFPNLPGKHLSWRRAGRGSWELITNPNGAVSVSASKRDVLTAHGRTYAWRTVDKHGFWDAGIEELTNIATNAPVLRKSGGHWDHKGDTRVTLTGQRELQFPVRGISGVGTMSAIDDSGNRLVEYRRMSSKHQSRFTYSAVEAVVSPAALTIPNIELLVAVSSPLLIRYFESSGGG